LKHADRQKFQSLAEDESAVFQVVSFRAREETFRVRIIDRSLIRKDASDANLEVLSRKLTDQEPLTDDELKHTRERE
jgi:predicted kinase